MEFVFWEQYVRIMPISMVFNVSAKMDIVWTMENVLMDQYVLHIAHSKTTNVFVFLDIKNIMEPAPDVLMGFITYQQPANVL